MKEIIQAVEKETGKKVLYVVLDEGLVITASGFTDSSAVFIEFKGSPERVFRSERLEEMRVYRYRTEDEIVQYNPVSREYLAYKPEAVVIEINKDRFLDSFSEVMRGLKR